MTTNVTTVRYCPTCEVPFFEDETVCPGHLEPLVQARTTPRSERLAPRWAFATIVDMLLVWGSALLTAWFVTLSFDGDWVTGQDAFWPRIGAITGGSLFAGLLIGQALLLRDGKTLGKALLGLELASEKTSWSYPHALLRVALPGLCTLGPVVFAAHALWADDSSPWAAWTMVAIGALLLLDGAIALVSPGRSGRDWIFGTSVTRA